MVSSLRVSISQHSSEVLTVRHMRAPSRLALRSPSSHSAVGKAVVGTDEGSKERVGSLLVGVRVGPGDGLIVGIVESVGVVDGRKDEVGNKDGKRVKVGNAVGSGEGMGVKDDGLLDGISVG